ncbi:Uncharacterized protein FWK35_00034470, partial [Aphis craccivora]
MYITLNIHYEISLNNTLISDAKINSDGSFQNKPLHYTKQAYVYDVDYKQCGGRVHVENEVVVKSYEHNHVPDNAQVETKELIYNMKHDAQTSYVTSHGVIGNLA